MILLSPEIWASVGRGGIEMKKIVLTVSVLALAAACKSKVPEPALTPQSETSVVETSGSGPVPAEPAAGVLNMPGNYVRSAVGQVGKAKEARSLYEKAEKERMKELERVGAAGQ